MSATALETPAARPARRRDGVWPRLLRDPVAAVALGFVVLAVLAALLAPWLAPSDPYDNNLLAAMKPPGTEGLPLGADGQGRDLVTRLLFGLRVTLLMGLVATLAGGLLGMLLGFLAAFYRRWLDMPIMRVMDVMLSFPAILVGLAIAAIAGPGIPAVVVAMSIATVPLMARITRGSALVVMQLDYVVAARAVGCTDAQVILRHLAPNCLSPIFVFATLRFGQVILLGSALSFLGLGAQPPTAELGAMASEGRNFLFFAPHIAVLPCLLIFLLVLAFNLLGDALRDALDPRMRF
ncbi:ABC transporter permease [Paracraurococcus ruber]|uniref:Glutathione ABC transporter permease GsiD n=1 Tax=Paracraurococcus ruber TaxID=77675 RepID=A0ABS1D0F5_9PROT|nr:ABC transporter permease [Paracraurococcus ruber]MBK1660281.1 glutathione ABC transporter permease GsiD [Paracraurococcus ruber]TDG31581.1 ABC transporter permease [Paracraurococcus ruber]